MTHLPVPASLIALELEHRAEKAAADARGKDSCHYAAYLLGKQVANHPWLTRHPGRSPERRAARKALRDAADDAQAVIDAQSLTPAVIYAEWFTEELAQAIAAQADA